MILPHEYPKVSAVICHNTATAPGAYLGALKIGNTISSADNYSYYNQEITLLGFDDIGSEALYHIPVSFITHPAREIGINAANRIIQRINESGAPPQSIMLAPGFSQLKNTLTFYCSLPLSTLRNPSSPGKAI